MQAIDRNPKHGITDRVVNTNDNVQIFIDLFTIIILSVGRILLEKNSLTYTISIYSLYFIFMIIN